MEQDTFDWGELGRDWWLATAHSVGATERHAKFAAAKHRGASNAEAARGAGFGTGSESSVRSEGYRLARSNKINQLLALAAAEAGGGYDGTLTKTEAMQILTQLARGSDPNVKIKAVDALQKLEDQQLRRAEAPENDGFGEWRLERDFITTPNGGCAWLMLTGGQLANLCLLHDTHHVVMREPDGPQLWASFYERLNEGARQDLDRRLADPSYQLEARKKIWGEIGQNPPGPLNSSAVDWRFKGGAETNAAA